MLRRNQFGSLTGGPITLGKRLIGKDSFFFRYHRQELADVNEGFVTTYTPALLNGNFSRTYNGGHDPFVLCSLTGNQYKAGRWDLFTTPFDTFERNIRDELGRVLADGGFDCARDIHAITVNRWPHG